MYDYDLAITMKMCELLDIHPLLRRTEEYVKNNGFNEKGLPCVLNDKGDEMVDFREVIHPKHPMTDPGFVPRNYYQVYGQKWGFLPNLCILDLLFNEGNEAVLYL